MADFQDMYRWLSEVNTSELDQPFKLIDNSSFSLLNFPVNVSDTQYMPASDITFYPQEVPVFSIPDFMERMQGEDFLLRDQSTQVLRTSPKILIDIDDIEKHKKQFTDTLLDLIHEEVFEYGMENAADVFFQKSLEMNSCFAKEWLNTIFLHRLGDVEVTTGILRIIAHLKYEDIYPTGPTMAIAAGMHENAEIRECGIRAFENWVNADSLRYLRRIRCGEKWLQDYLEQVIIDLEEYNAASR